MSFADRLKEARISSGLTQKQLGEKIGIAGTTITGYEKGNSEPSMAIIQKLMEVLKIDANFLWQDEIKNIAEIFVSLDERKLVQKYRDLDDHGRETVNIILDRETDRMKMLNKHFAELAVQAEQIIELKKAEPPTRIISYYQRLASAGSGEYLFDSVPTDTIEVPLNELSEEADFVIGVNGDSMEPTFCDGDRVYVKIVDEISTGQIGIFIKGSECFIKEVGDGRLKSHNHKYPDIYPNEEIRLVGRVLGKIVE